jgi:hypothetical protein
MTNTSQEAEVILTFPVLGEFITEYLILFSDRNLRSLRDGQFRWIFSNLPSQSISLLSGSTRLLFALG